MDVWKRILMSQNFIFWNYFNNGLLVMRRTHLCIFFSVTLYGCFLLNDFKGWYGMQPLKSFYRLLRNVYLHLMPCDNRDCTSWGLIFFSIAWSSFFWCDDQIAIFRHKSRGVLSKSNMKCSVWNKSTRSILVMHNYLITGTI